MEEESGARSMRLVNFISEEQLDQAKKARGERVDDGTAQRDRPLYEILKENKDKKDAEFNERFKHRPPKALDEDETEFLDKLEMSRKEYERQLEDEETQQLRSFQEAVAAQALVVRELKETPAVPRPEEHKPVAKRSQHTRSGNLIISVKPQAKKAKTDATVDKSSNTGDLSNGHVGKQPKIDASSEQSSSTWGPSNGPVAMKSPDVAESTLGGLVSYSDESEEED